MAPSGDSPSCPSVPGIVRSAHPVTFWDMWRHSCPPDRGWGGRGPQGRQLWASTARPGQGVAGAVSSPSAGLAAGGHRGRAGSLPGRRISRAMDTDSAGNAVLQAWGSGGTARHGTARWHGTIRRDTARCSLALPEVAPPVVAVPVAPLATAPRPCPSRWAPAASPAAPRPGGRELTRDPPRYKFCIVRGWGELGGSQGRL